MMGGRSSWRRPHAHERESRKGIKEGKRLGEEEVHLPPLVPNPAYLGVHTYSSTIGKYVQNVWL